MSFSKLAFLFFYFHLDPALYFVFKNIYVVHTMVTRPLRLSHRQALINVIRANVLPAPLPSQAELRQIGSDHVWLCLPEASAILSSSPTIYAQLLFLSIGTNSLGTQDSYPRVTKTRRMTYFTNRPHSELVYGYGQFTRTFLLNTIRGGQGITCMTHETLRDARKSPRPSTETTLRSPPSIWTSSR